MTKNYVIKSLRIGPEKNFTYLITSLATGEAALIDPSFEFQKIKEWVGTAKINYLIATHGHWDHAGGFNEMLKIYPEAKVVAHKLEQPRLDELKIKLDFALEDEQIFKIGDVQVKVFHTPGHTVGGCCYQVGNELFTGDTLFIGQCGRTDLNGGSDKELFNSLQKLKKLDKDLTVFPGHDYGSKPFSTLEEQMKTNPTLRVTTLQEFIDLP